SLSTVFLLVQIWRLIGDVGHSLSAGGPGASSAHLAPVGSPLDSLFPQESRTLRSNQLCLKILIELLLPTVFFVLKRKQIWLNVGS
ncbi:hypothetical protein ABEY24_01520, partial [Peribacillus frigoritolerans]|uniref:hypothetical protein n=1 Tax=Peribacillus frigoritolerans TaxID=450367 RepID=UPI003D2D95C4